MSERGKIILNIACSLLLQAATIISGFVVPKLILSYFGSETNGLVTSLTQFLSYVSLLEGGMSGVIMASLYAPIKEGDLAKISGIVNAAKKFFFKVGAIYVAYMLVVAIVYPLVFSVKFSKIEVFALVFVIGTNLLMQHFASVTYKQLISADKKVWFNSLVQTAVIVANIVVVLLCARYTRNILAVKAASVAVFLVQPLTYYLFANKKFKLDKKAPPDKEALKHRWDGFGQTVAYFIHTNTDVVILTIFASFLDVSVYSVYMMVTTALKTMVVSVSSAIIPSVGSVLVSGDREKISKAFDNYEFGMAFFTTMLFSCGIALVTPFVKVYTASLPDAAAYIQPVFGIILMTAEMVYCLRDPFVSVSYAAGKFRETAPFAYAEAALNIVLSLVLVNFLGLVGIATGTLAAMALRTVLQAIYLRKNIVFRSIWKFIKLIAVFGAATVGSVLLSKLIVTLDVTGYITWGIAGLCTFGITLVVVGVLSVLFYRSELKAMLSKNKGKKEVAREDSAN